MLISLSVGMVSMNRSILHSLFGITTLALLITSLTGCGPTEPVKPKQDTTSVETEQLRTEVLCDLVNNVAIPIIDDFDARSAELLEAITTLAQGRTEANLAAARQAWRDTREPWEMCEAFLFGPAKVQQLDPAVDSWPLDQITLESMLNSSDVFTKAYIDLSEGSVKGAHAIEYLLWGDKGNKRVDQITPRELEFMIAAAESFRGSAGALRRAWIPMATGGDGYGDQVCNAGKEGSIYTKRATAVREFVNGVVFLLVEVADAKMGIPYGAMNTDFEEARFSNNSKDDFRANLLGVKSIYMGSYGNRSGKGLRDLVRRSDIALDSAIQTMIETARVRIEGITPSFGAAILPGGNRSSVQSARLSLSMLADLFSVQVSQKVLH